MAASETASPAGGIGRVFATTRWTVVLQAGGPTSQGSTAALAKLCQTYWYPLYYYARRTGVAPHDAEDLTQSFFAFLLGKNLISRADPNRGRFRFFLLSSFRNFHSNQRAQAATAKRGGGKVIVPLDEWQAEQRYQHEPASTLSPEKLYDQKWAASLLEHALLTLRAEYVALNKGPLFDLLRQVILDGADTGYDALARQAGLTANAFKVAVHRVRARFRETLRHEVAQTVATSENVDDELRHLLAALGT